MKKLVLAVLLLSVFACKENPVENPNQNNAVVAAESSISGKLSSDSYRGGNVVNNIYYEMIKNDDKLKQVDEKIEKIFIESNKIIDEKNKILTRSDNYYADANSMTRGFGDSVLKKQTEAIIKSSSDKYDAKTLALRNLITKLERGNVNLTDNYSVFKIKKTLPEIEKYQNQNPLNSKDLEKLVSEQNHLLEEIKKL